MKKKLILIILASILLSGCIPKLGGGDDSVSNKDEFVKGKPISGFPNIPRFPKAEIIESVENEGSFGATFVTNDGIDKVVDFYNEALPQLGWESQLAGTSNSGYSFQIKNATWAGEIIVNTADDNKSTAISVSVSPR